MKLDLQTIRAILEGRFEGEFLAELLATDVPLPERIPFPRDCVGDEVDIDEACDVFRELLASGSYLRALALLKLLGERYGPTAELLSLLGEALLLDAAEDSTDPLPREFLGTQRARIAWAVVQKDMLGFTPCTANGPDLGSRGWLVSRDDTIADERVDGGLALVWWSTTRVAGTLRPAGTRKQARRRLELSATVVFLGPIREKTGLSRASAEVQDLSDTCAGISIRDRFGRLAGIGLEGARVRLELRRPDTKDLLSTLAIVRWVDQSADMNEGQVCRIGIKFDDPPPEFVSSVQQLLSPGKGDVQYLWSLWESDSQKA